MGMIGRIIIPTIRTVKYIESLKWFPRFQAQQCAISPEVAQLIATKTNKIPRHSDHVVEFFYTHGVTQKT